MKRCSLSVHKLLQFVYFPIILDCASFSTTLANRQPSPFRHLFVTLAAGKRPRLMVH